MSRRLIWMICKLPLRESDGDTGDWAYSSEASESRKVRLFSLGALIRSCICMYLYKYSYIEGRRRVDVSAYC